MYPVAPHAGWAAGAGASTTSPPQPTSGSLTALGVLVCNVSSSHVDTAEVLGAVETLYADELKPYGRILRKRLAERARGAGLGAVDIDIKRLRTACEACPLLHVQAEEGGDWSALLHGHPASFVDVYSPQDPYPSQLWRSASLYFEALDDADMVLPGGRYSCAQALASRGLPFLAGRSLGQICHVVQLAISQKKLLGYLNGAVVPYSRSQSMVKERCAERQRPCTGAARGTSQLADWETVRACLKEILTGVSLGSGSIPLSNVKRLFRSRFHVELSETALGHAKLSELLQDHRLWDVCSVRLQGHGYVVAPPEQRPQRRGAPALAPGVEAIGRGAVAAEPAAAAVEVACEPPAATARPRARWAPAPLSLDDIIAPPVALDAGPGDGHAKEATSPAQAEFAPQTPSPTSVRRARSLPRLLGNLRPPLVGQEPGKVVEECLADAKPRALAALEVPVMEAVAPQPPAQPVLTPSTLGNMGLSVQNTFIHAAMPPPTPPAGASCRSYSLPRNMGSEMNLLESPSSEGGCAPPRRELSAPWPGDAGGDAQPLLAAESACGSGQRVVSLADLIQ